MVNRKKLIAIVLLVLAVAGFATHYFYWYHLVNTSPSTPNPITGQIYMLNDHGYFFFVTHWQKIVGDVCLGVFVVAGLIAAFLNVRYKLFKSVIDDAPKRFY